MKDQSRKILTLPLRLVLIVLIFGALFKVMHWSYAKELMLIGGISIGVLYTIRFFNKKNKVQLDYVKVAFVLLWILNYFIKAFHLFSIPYILELALLILFLWWFISEGMDYINNRSFKKKGIIIKIIYYLLIGITVISLFFGVLFKIQHWPYGSELFVLGTLLLCIALVLDYFVIEETK